MGIIGWKKHEGAAKGLGRSSTGSVLEHLVPDPARQIFDYILGHSYLPNRMSLKVFMNLEKRSFYILMISVLGILWWVAIYGLVNDLMDHIRDKYKISYRVQSIFIIAFVLFVILIHPDILEKF